MNFQEYDKANKMGIKNYRKKLGRGEYPYLPVLDHITRYTSVKREVYLGLMDIPLDLVVGTVTEGRSNAFASNFMPLLDDESEFAMKWDSLCDWHLNEGIHDPIKVYEFMDRFYVQEGNKRVSVLKYFDAVSVPANVYRIVPEYREDDEQIRIYYEFMKFFDLTGLNVIWFSKEGSYRALIRETGNSDTEHWSEDEILTLRSLYNRTDLAIAEKKQREKINVSDAMLRLIQIYDYESLCEDSAEQLKEKLNKAWEEMLVLKEPETIDLKLDPVEENTSAVKQVMKILNPDRTRYVVGFVHDKNPKSSGWTNAHELGKAHLENKYPDLTTHSYMDALADGDGEEVIRQAVSDGCNVIFTTSPKLLDASVKVALDCPQVRILNCSLNTSYKTVRTYYGRMYEAKFLAGLVAGAMSPDGKIAYVADYPLYGMISNINAFALGVQMTNPRARVKLIWSKLKNGVDWEKELEGISVISQQEMTCSNSRFKDFGLCLLEDGERKGLAIPVWDWGKYYEKIFENIRHGIWKSEEESRALNYWWGLSAGVVDTILSLNVPEGVKKLVLQMGENIKRGDFKPFSGILKAQDGVEITHHEHTLIAPKDIMTMDWLLENVDGRIPQMSEFMEEAKEVVRVQGVTGVEDEDTGNS